MTQLVELEKEQGAYEVCAANQRREAVRAQLLLILKANLVCTTIYSTAYAPPVL